MSGHIINDFKDLRSLIGEITKANPAKTTRQKNEKKMGVYKEAPEAQPVDDKKPKDKKYHAGEEEIKRAYLNLGRAAQGSLEYQRKLLQKELAKMGFKTYSQFAFDAIFKFETVQQWKKNSELVEAIEQFKLDENKLKDLLIDIQMGATAKELARDHNISIASAKNFLSDYYGNKRTRKAPGLKKEENIQEVQLGPNMLRKDFPNVWATKDSKLYRILNTLIIRDGFTTLLKSYKKDKKKFVDDLKGMAKSMALQKRAGFGPKDMQYINKPKKGQSFWSQFDEDVQERFNQKIPAGRKLKDFEVFLGRSGKGLIDKKEIEEALKIITIQLKKDKLDYNRNMMNLKAGAKGGKDVTINAIDEEDRWRLIVVGEEKSDKFEDIDLSASFEKIQKLPSAQFKSMWAEAFNYTPKEFEGQIKAYKYKNGVKFSQVMKDFDDDWDSAFGNRGYDHDEVENGLKQALKKFRVKFVEGVDEGKYLKYSDYLLKQGRLYDKLEKITGKQSTDEFLKDKKNDFKQKSEVVKIGREIKKLSRQIDLEKKALGIQEDVQEGKMKDIIIDFEDGVSDAKIAKSHGVSIQVIKGLRKDWKSMGEENLKERVGFKKLRQIKSKWKKQIADFQRGKDLDYDAEVDLLAYAYDKGLVRSDDPDEVDDWLMKNVADKRAFNKLKEESKEDKLKEQREHAQQSPFKLKSQAYPRAIAINTDGFGNRHATVEDIITACDTFGMILDKELQVEQVQKELGKRGFISFKQSDLDDVFDERETQRVILALESAVEKQEPIDYTKDEVEDAYIMGEEIEFVKPDGLKTAGKVLKLSGNTYNVKDKFTGKSFTYKYIGETEVKTFKEVLNEGRFPKKLVKQAMGIVWDKRYAGGNMTGAVKAIEKLKKGLSDDPDVSNALRLANEGIDKWIPEGGDKEAYTKFFNKALKKFGVNSPDELEGEKKKEFFDYVDKNWKGDHEEKEANPSDHKIDGRRKNFREKMRKLGYIKGN